jgi:hypothetical protein
MKKNAEYVGVDEQFIPEEEKYVDESLLGNKEESNRKIKKAAKSFAIGYAIFFVVMFTMAIGMTILIVNNFTKAGNSMMDDAIQKSSSMREEFDEQVKQMQNN